MKRRCTGPKCASDKHPEGRLHPAGKCRIGDMDLGMCQQCARASGLLGSRGNLYRIYPTPEQERQLRFQEATVRFVYNMRVRETEWLLADWDADRKRHWRETRERLFPEAQGKLTAKQYQAVKAAVPDSGPPPKGWRARRIPSYTKGIVPAVMKEGKWMERMPDMSQAVASTLDATLMNFAVADKNWSAGRARRPTWKKPTDPVGIPVTTQQDDTWGKFELRGKKGEKKRTFVPGALRTSPDGKHWLKVPKAGLIEMRVHRPWKGIPRSVTVRRDSTGQWYASVLSAWVRPLPQHRNPGIVGIDPGVVIGACTSDPDFPTLPRIEANPSVKKLRERHARLQQQRARRLARAWQRTNPGAKCSTLALVRDNVFKTKNHQKAQHKLAKLSRKEQRIRDDAHQKWAQQVASKFEVVAFEDSKVKALTKRKPGAGRAGRAANRALMGQSWYGLSLKLQQKLEAYGGQLVRIPAPYTSQQCSACGSLAGTVRATQARFECRDCGYTGNADFNAATNIRNIAVAKIQAGDEHVSARARAAVARIEIPKEFYGLARSEAVAARRKAKTEERRSKSAPKPK